MDKFRDPIHGFVEVNKYEKQIIDSLPFQRLRNIKQLAMTYLVFHGAEHTRFGHSLGVMHLVTKAFNSAIQDYEEDFPKPKVEWCIQVLRLIGLLHDIGHAPFSHASESVFPEGIEHEDYTAKIIKETEIADIISKIGAEFVEKYGEEFDITPELICEIYSGHNPGPNSEYTFLKTFMDSELDCDKMDYLLRDSYYCGVEYGKYDVERLISSFTICYTNGAPRLAIKTGGVQAFEEFVLARYFMFIQVYFHRTRRYFDIMLGSALKSVLPGGKYPESVDEYLKWDDCRVIQLLKDNVDKFESCKNIVERKIYPRVYYSKTHPIESDKREYKLVIKSLNKEIGEEFIIEDKSAGKMPHKIPKRVELNDEKAIVIYDRDIRRKRTISEESEIIKSLSEKIDIMRIYCHPDKVEQAREIIQRFNPEE